MKRIKVCATFIALAICFFGMSKAKAASINVASCSASAVQAGIEAAQDFDIVLIPAGSCTWTNGISLSNKNITLQGAGQGATVITASSSADPTIHIIADTKASFRITGLTINYNYISKATINLSNNTSAIRSGWRIDHVTFNQTGGGDANASHPIVVIGLLWGLVDNCVFNDGGNGQQSVSHYAYVNNVESSDNVGRLSWENVQLGLGTDSAVYVEDCIFNHSTANMSSVNDTQFGGRMVMRYNTIYNSMVMTHSAWGRARGGMKLEFYNNTMTSTVGYLRPALIRSGTGVIFNNTVSGNYQLKAFSIDNQRSCISNPTLCNGNDSTYDGNAPGQQGWPCEDQPGVGSGVWKNQILEPWYAWNNGTYAFVNSSACNSPQVQLGRDYFNNGTTPKPNYTPYTYPHPLRNFPLTKAGSPSIQPPMSLKKVN